MGKWRTYRSRGTSVPESAPDLRPPPPALSVVVGSLIQAARGQDDTDGTVQIYSSPTGVGPWTLVDFTDWDWTHNWGAIEDFPVAYYAVTETGNGVTYVGESNRSTIIHLPL
jgi:hypothetical protein